MPLRSSANKGFANDNTSTSRFTISTRKTDVNDADAANPRKAPSSFPASTMQPTSNRDSNSSNGSLNGGQKLFLTHRRRQSSIPNAKALMGPRPISRDVQNKRFTSNSIKTLPSYYDTVRAAAEFDNREPYVHDFPLSNDDTHFSFAAIDPTATVPQDQREEEEEERHESPSFSAFQEPTFTFDDFHDNIATEPSLGHFPFPGGPDPFPLSTAPAVPKIEPRRTLPQTTIPIPTRKSSGTGLNPLVRKSSNASSSGRAYITKNEPVTATNAASNSVLKGRRQSQFPPNAFNNTNPAPVKAPRKSIGPGTFLPPDGVEIDPVSRPVVNGRKSSAENIKTGGGRLASRNGDGSREGSKSPRTIKTRSIMISGKSGPVKDQQVPSRTPDPQRSISLTAQSTPSKRSNTPGRTTTPGASRRMSVMPSHASGLGARTISPTDSRRLKRMSVMPQAPPVPNRRISQAPPTPQPDGSTISRPRSTVHSPALPNRKEMTPSSSRATPDQNRVSYHSNSTMPIGSAYGSGRNSKTGNFRMNQQNTSSSRLPTPKPRTETGNSMEEEIIPPVPAIPKSYESPASEIEQPFFSARNSNLTNSSTPVSASPTLANLAEAMAGLDFPRPYSSSSDQVPSIDSKQSMEPLPLKIDTQQGQPKPTKKVGSNLRLPPINLLPLSTPTSAKIKAFQESRPDHPGSPSTPPGARMRKTPSTPMTASKATFFSRSHGPEPQGPKPSIRSSTSHYALRQDKSLLDDLSPSLPMFNFESDNASHRSISPFISSSLPKDGAEFPSYMRPNFNSELRRNQTQQRPNGPRAPSYSIPIKQESSSQETSDQSGKVTPVVWNGVSEDRISRRRSETKLADVSASNSDAAKYDNMPPPKLPASATWNNLASKVSASPTQKPGFFRSRRKTSGSSVNTASGTERQDSFDSAITHVSNARPSLESVRSSIMSHSNRSGSLLAQSSSLTSKSSQAQRSDEQGLDKDDMTAEEEMRKLASKRRDLESAARKLDSLIARAKPVPRLTSSMVLQSSDLNIFERGEIIDCPDVYFTGTKQAKKIVGDLSSTSTNFGYDDDRGDYNIIEGDHLLYRYEVIDTLGKGSFGQVVRCIDHKTGTLVAIKIIRNKKRFHQQALVEVDILKKLKEWDPEKKHNVVNFDQSFYFRGHLCISTDLLDMNLYEFIKIHDFRGFSLKLIRRFTKQILASLVLLHGKRVIHCDLKPENILLCHPAQGGIKVIDFGSSCFENEKVYTYIQSRFYRSPEVILGMSYGMPIDMWSVGCILAELYTGYPIFPGENEQEQLACIMEVFGPPEKHLIEKSSRKKLFFDSMGKPRLIVSSKGRRRRPSSKELRQVLKCDDEPFLDFIARCLRWDPVRRMNPHEAMRHEFITGMKPAPLGARRNIVNALNSPLKRGNSITGGPTRPLPQPPGGGLKPNAPNNAYGASPNKAAPRRQSTAVNGLNAASHAKRASHAAMNTSNSAGNFSRVVTGQRNTNGRPDLAQAAATASLVK